MVEGKLVTLSYFLLVNSQAVALFFLIKGKYKHK